MSEREKEYGKGDLEEKGMNKRERKKKRIYFDKWIT